MEFHRHLDTHMDKLTVGHDSAGIEENNFVDSVPVDSYTASYLIAASY